MRRATTAWPLAVSLNPLSAVLESVEILSIFYQVSFSAIFEFHSLKDVFINMFSGQLREVEVGIASQVPF